MQRRNPFLSTDRTNSINRELNDLRKKFCLRKHLETSKFLFKEFHLIKSLKVLFLFVICFQIFSVCHASTLISTTELSNILLSPSAEYRPGDVTFMISV